MTRDERRALLARWVSASKQALGREIAEELDLRRRLKEARCPDLSPVIDRLTVLVGIWCGRYQCGVLHQGEMAAVDKGGELWVTPIGVVRGKLILAQKRAQAIDGEGGLVVEEEERQGLRDRNAAKRAEYRSETREARELEHRRRMDAVLAAARALHEQGESLTMAAMARQASLPYTTMQGLVAAIRRRNEWPEGLVIVRGTVSTVKPFRDRYLSAERPDPEPAGPVADDGVRWVDLPGIPSWQGTITGRVRRSPEYVHAGPLPPKVKPGEEVQPRGPLHQYALKTSQGNRSLTPLGVARLVATVTGEVVPRSLDRRTKDGPAKRAQARAVAG